VRGLRADAGGCSTLIPFDRAFIQEGTHISLGRIRISGSVAGDAASGAALRAWVNGRRALGVGSELPPKDRMKHTFLDGDPNTLRGLELSFSFEWILNSMDY